MKKLSMPGVINVSDGAFRRTLLEEVSMPKVQIISKSAFYECYYLKKVDFGNQNYLTTINSMAFSDCTSLEEITLPGSIQNLRAYIFSGSSSLTRIEVSGSGLFTSVDGVPYTSDLKTFVACPCGLVNITLLESTVTIADQSFYGCKNLLHVRMNDQIHTITGNAFFMCEKITFVRIPGNIQHIGRSAFNSCPKLRHVLCCTDHDCPSFDTDPFPTNPNVYVFFTFPPGGTFCLHDVQRILDLQCNLPTWSFTAAVGTPTPFVTANLFSIVSTALLFE